MRTIFTITILTLTINVYSQKLVKTYWDYRKTKIQSEYYSDAYGTKNGAYKGYSEYGGILLQGSYKDDAPIGKWTENYLDGKLHFIKIYTSPGYTNFDVNDGKIISYYEDGKTIKYERNFKNHELDGDCKEYDETGKIIKEGIYVNGVFEKTGISKKLYEEEQEKQKQLEAEMLLKKTDEYKKIIPAADKAYDAKDYIKALELYKSASELLGNEKYPRDKTSEIIETYHTNSKFFQDYTKAEYDSLEQDKMTFSKEIPLKTFDSNGMVATNSKGETYRVAKYVDVYQQQEIDCTKPWVNRNWEDVKNCFDGNLKSLYTPTQYIITEEFFKFKKILETEEANIKKTEHSFNFDNTNNSFYTYDKKTFLDNISTGRKKYTITKSLIALQIKNSQIENLNSQNNKKTLFRKYQFVYKDFSALLQSSTELQSLADNLNKLNLFLDKVITLYSQDNKELEKQLKDAETAEQIKNIILQH